MRGFSNCSFCYAFVLRVALLAIAFIVSHGSAAAAAPVSDDFHAATLNSSLWTLVNPAGGSSSLNGTNLLIVTPAGSNHDPSATGANNSVRVMQPSTNVDFGIEVKFDSIPTQAYTNQGVVVQQDANNFLRFEFYGTGGGTNLFAGSIASGVQTDKYNQAITPSGSSLWLRIVRSGNNWTLSWSNNGNTYLTATNNATFQTAVSFTQTLTVAQVGPFAANFQSPASAAPAFTASVDFFQNTASPIIPEDGGGGGGGVPDLTITKSHSGSFTQGGAGSYTLTVSNAGTGPTTAAVTVTDTLPSGLTYTSATGTGWTCVPGPPVNCTRPADALAASASYPAITLTVSVTAPPPSVTNTASVAGGGETNTANNSASDPTTITASGGGGSAPVSDDFHAGTLNTSLWTLVNPAGGSSSLNGTNLLLLAPAGSNHDPTATGTNNSVRVMQPSANIDFGIEVKFDSIPTQAYTNQGVLVQQDATNFLRFELYGTGGGTNLFAGVIASGAQTTKYNQPVTISGSSIWLRITRSGSNWTFGWSTNGNTFATATNNATFQTAVSFAQILTVAQVGPFAANFQSPASAAPAFTASVDFFQNTASPVIPEDGGGGSSGVPDLTITKSHSGSFTQGGAGSYTLTVSNAGTGPTTAAVTVTDTLPSGLTFTSATGTGWTCVGGPPVSCTRPADALAASASYPPITLAVSVTAPPPSVTNTASVTGGGETNTANNSANDPTTITASGGGGSAPVSDDFHATTLNTTLWMSVNPAGGSNSVNGTNLLLVVPAGSIHDPTATGTNNSVRVMQPTANVDFGIEVKFDSIPTQAYTNQGVLVQQDAANFLRFELYGTGSGTSLFAGAIASGVQTEKYNQPITISGSSFWLRIVRSGSNWTLSWSTNGNTYKTATNNATFQTAVTFAQALTVAQVGPFAANWQSPASAAPGFTASVDFFYNTASPIVPEEGGAEVSVSDLTITKTHSGTFTQGGVGSYTLTVSNAGAGPSSGAVTVKDTLPSGLTLSNASGTGWVCVAGPPVSCTRSDALAASASYPAITLTVTVTAPPPSVTNTATVSGGGETNTANNSATDVTPISTPSGGPISDDFHAPLLNTALWTFVNPFDGTYQLNGTNLLLTVPPGFVHDPTGQGANYQVPQGNYSARAVQSIANVNFGVELKFDSIPTTSTTEEGLLVEQDGSNFLRFEFYGNGSGTNLFVGAIASNTQTTKYNQAISLSGTSIWLRVVRSGSVWTVSWSPDGVTYQTALTFNATLTVARLGPMAGNYDQEGGKAPGFTASVDYFYNTASPIVNGDGGSPEISNVSAIPSFKSAAISWNTDVQANSTVDYGPTTSYGATVSNASLTPGHSTLVTGLTCGNTYNYRVTSVDGASHPAQSANFTFTTAGCGGGGAPVSDSFDGSSLSPSTWSWRDPLGDSRLTLNGNTAQITVPANSIHNPWAPTGNNSARVMQSIADTNFDVTVKFVSEMAWAGTSQGIIVEQDALNYLRFEFTTDGISTRVVAGTRNGGTQQTLVNTPITIDSPLWLKVTRSGSSWTVSWSADGANFAQAGAFTQAIVASGIGIFAANVTATAYAVPAFTANADFFMNNAIPVSNVASPLSFARIVVDPAPGVGEVEKTMADLDGDGLPDVLLGFEHPTYGIYWYRQPHSGVLTSTWNKFPVTTTGEYYEDISGLDINGDGAIDVLVSVIGTNSILWFENPRGHGGDPTKDVWVPHVIGNGSPGAENNFALADIDGDGKLDIVTPSFIYFKNTSDSWTSVRYNGESFRGMALLDIGSGKGRINMVGSSPDRGEDVLWFENPRETGGNARTGTWISHLAGPGYQCTNPVTCPTGAVSNYETGDLNGDGRADIVTVQSEGFPFPPPGGLIWWEAPVDRRTGQWIKHTIDPDFIHSHNVQVMDFDKNGTLDVMVSQQEQSPERRVSIFFNDGHGNFSQQILGNTGGHNPWVVDINNDGWLDILNVEHGVFGAPNPVELYINRRGGYHLP